MEVNTYMSDACERIFTEILESNSLVNIKALPKGARLYVVDRLVDLFVGVNKLSIEEMLDVQSLAISYLELYLGDKGVVDCFRVEGKGVNLTDLVSSCVVLAFNHLGWSKRKFFSLV